MNPCFLSSSQDGYTRRALVFLCKYPKTASVLNIDAAVLFQAGIILKCISAGLVFRWWVVNGACGLFARRAARADNSRVRYATEEHRRTSENNYEMPNFVCADENMKGRRRMEGGKTRRCERLLREQPSVELYNVDV